MDNPLGKYRLGFAAHYTGSTPPEPQTLAKLGVTSAKISCAPNGQDEMTLAADVDLSAAAFPFLPLGKHTLYDADDQVRFIGWLTQPGRNATQAAQSQEFVFEGPNYLLRALPYLEPWQVATDPTNPLSATSPQMLSRSILFRTDAGAKRKLSDQVLVVLDYCIAQHAAAGRNDAFAYSGLAHLPGVYPTEDEQQDRDCASTLDRIMQWAPMVVRRWKYRTDGVPELVFVGPEASTLTITPNDPTQGINGFKSRPRYDLLVRQITVNATSEQTATDGTITTHWGTVIPDVSTADDNGSIIDRCFTYPLRGESNNKHADGTPIVPKEELPTGLSAALHEPFKTLYESISWYKIGEDVDWTTTLGQFVDVHRVSTGGGGGTVGLVSFGVASRSAIQRITRTLETGRTDFEAGPPTRLGLNDLLNLRRVGANRNAANAGAGTSGYTAGYKAPESKETGVCSGGPGAEGGNALGPNYYLGVANGLPAYYQINGSGPLTSLPEGATVVNPP